MRDLRGEYLPRGPRSVPTAAITAHDLLSGHQRLALRVEVQRVALAMPEVVALDVLRRRRSAALAAAARAWRSDPSLPVLPRLVLVVRGVTDQALPAVLQSEEMIYYVSGKFGSRKGVDVGSITPHPSGLPHGPQPGLAENGMHEISELTVMCDTFHPLKLSTFARDLDDGRYGTRGTGRRRKVRTSTRRTTPPARASHRTMTVGTRVRQARARSQKQ